jgi:poly(hydroxyalkanoate) granule-associated protein
MHAIPILDTSDEECYTSYDALRHRIIQAIEEGDYKMATKAKVEAKVEEVKDDIFDEKEPNPLFEAARKVLLAGIGAIALGKEEIEDFVNKLVERGEIAEKDGRKLVKEIMEKRTKDAKKAEEEMTKRVETALDRMNVPIKDDIDELSKKIDELSKKLDEMKKS